MRIIFSGASSFTGTWFCKELALRGHEVIALFSKPQEAYQGIRKERIETLLPYVKPLFNTPLSTSFEGDIFCHHASLVEGYNKPDFDALKALQNNIQGLSIGNFRCVIYTGSVFEQGEGFGSMPLETFSPYGLSKTLTSNWLQYLCAKEKVEFRKFVIANPFGPLEEPRFTHYLLESWKKGLAPEVKTPSYVRDNIPISALAAAYADFVEKGQGKLTPTGIAGTQGAFTEMLSRRFALKLGKPCPYTLLPQTQFLEPRMRIGIDPLPQYDEEAFWETYLA